MTVYIQHGLYEDYTEVGVKIGTSIVNVPLWVWMELDGGGIRAMISSYYELAAHHGSTEDNALSNIERQAKSILRYHLRGNRKKILNKTQSKLLELDRESKKELKLTGFERLQWIAKEMGNGYGWQQVKAMLEDVSVLLNDAESEEYNEYVRKLKTKLPKASPDQA